VCVSHSTNRILGAYLDPRGVQPNDKKIVAIRDFLVSKSVKGVKSFIGLINFYHRFIPDMATLSRPLTALTRKSKATGRPVLFEWSQDCDSAFRLVSIPVLHPLDMDKSFILWTDASEQGFRAILEQKAEYGD